ncbi:DUF4180 domain-containing protein [uncultured Meiothermus sp.]|uniref:DUF4180 domain-containing protein n=1 Tax=uncultured Meiothermus sp. TaxID=157471 RepID=UPI002633F85E|nr:DUF4180 domain-containing protein [uncultured Meiothermus sp.]
MNILVAPNPGLSLLSVQDIPDVIEMGMGADGLILLADELPQTFFDLRTGFAGELFQKLVNYQIRSVLVLPDFNAYGQRFAELAYEHRVHPQIRFVRTLDEAVGFLQKSLMADSQ